MKSFLRENPTIAFGLGLPLLLVAVFLLISGIPTLTVAPPQYDVLYTTGYRHYEQDVQISVVEQKIQIVFREDIRRKAYDDSRLRLWRYNSQTGGVREVVINRPLSAAQAEKEVIAADQSSEHQASKLTMIDMPELTGMTLDSSSIAPDGYKFRADVSRNSGNVFGSLFYSHRHRYDAQLTKSGRNIRLPNTVGRYYGRTAKLVGWVVAE